MGSQEEFQEYALLGGGSHHQTLKGMKIRINNAFVWVSYKQYGQKGWDDQALVHGTDRDISIAAFSSAGGTHRGKHADLSSSERRLTE